MNIFKKFFSKKSFIAQAVTSMIPFGARFRVRSTSSDPYGAIAGWVYFALDKIAMAFSGAELQLFQLTPQGDVVEVKSHEILDLFEKPNPTMSGREMRYTLSIYMSLWGISHLYKEMDKGRIVALWPVRPDLLSVIKHKNGFPVAYKYKVGGAEIEIAASELITMKKPSAENPTQGMSAVMSITHEIDADMAAAVWQKYLIENNAEPGGVLETDQHLTDDQFNAIRDGWEARHSGPTNAARISVLEAGLKYRSIATTPKEMDYVASRQMSRDTILTILGVPKGLVIADDVNRANADAAQHVFALNTIDPLLKMFCEAVSNTMVIEVDSTMWLWYKPVVQQDREQMRLDVQVGLNKFLTINEAREMYGKDPVDGGDDLYVTVADVSVGQEKSLKTVRVQSKLTTRMSEIKSRIIRRNGKKERFVKRIADSITARVVAIKGVSDVKIESKGAKAEDDPWKGIHTKVKVDRLEFLTKSFPKRAKTLKKSLKKVFNAQEEAIKKFVEENIQAKAPKKNLEKQIADILDDGELETIIKDSYVVNIVDGATAVSKLMDKPQSIIGETSPKVVSFLKTAPNEFATQVNDTTMQELRDSLSEGVDAQESMSDLMVRVSDVFDEARSYRSEMIARTEIGKAQNFGRFSEMGELGLSKRMWVATGVNTRSWHMEANGQIAEGDEPFDVDGEQLMYPQEPGASPENCINCQCTISPASEYFTPKS